MSDAIAVVLFFGITAYAVFGGADFGAGFWDLVAGGASAASGPRHDRPFDRTGVGSEPRLADLLPRGPVDRFPEAFAAIMLTLFVPLTLAAFGIVLRGSSFAFRKAVFRTRDQRNFGAAFALASVIVPYCMGSVAGAIASAEFAGTARLLGLDVAEDRIRLYWRPIGPAEANLAVFVHALGPDGAILTQHDGQPAVAPARPAAGSPTRSSSTSTRSARRRPGRPSRSASTIPRPASACRSRPAPTRSVFPVPDRAEVGDYPTPA